MLGYIESLSPNLVELRPIVIATRWALPTPEFDDLQLADPLRLYPSLIDQFADVDFSSRLTKADLTVLKDVPEETVKRAFAEILGEPDVPKDWGGEQYDLWTTHLFVERQMLTAAVMFKGPAKFSPMTIKSLGEQGDQIDRLADTPADVLVVQHCHSITSRVANMLRAYASDFRRPRRYLLIDGYDTIRILRHFGRLPI